MSFSLHIHDENYVQDGYTLISVEDFPEYILDRYDEDWIFFGYWQPVSGFHGKPLDGYCKTAAIKTGKFELLNNGNKVKALVGGKDMPPEGFKLLNESLYGNYVLTKDDLIFLSNKWKNASPGVCGLKASVCYGKKNSYFSFTQICIPVSNNFPHGF